MKEFADKKKVRGLTFKKKIKCTYYKEHLTQK